MTDIGELAELIQMELLHGCDPETATVQKYKHVATCVLTWLQDRGWGEVEPGGVNLSASETEVVAIQLVGAIQSVAETLVMLGALIVNEEEEF